MSTPPKRSLHTAIAAATILLANTGSAQEDGLAAVVNGKVITRSEVQAMVTSQEQMIRIQYRNQQHLIESKLQELADHALDTLIDRELITAAFEEKDGIIKDHYIDSAVDGIIRENFDGDKESFQKALSAQGMSMRRFRELQEKSLIVRFMRQNNVGQLPPPTPEEIEAEYQAGIADFRGRDFVKLRTITIPKFTAEPGTTADSQRKLTEDVRNRLLDGADFAEAAKTHSRDSRAEEGGDWGWIERDVFKKEMSDLAFGLKPGAISEVVEDERAFIIMWVEAKRPGKAQPLSEVRDTVEKRVLQKKGKALEDQWLKRLRQEAVIEKFDS